MQTDLQAGAIAAGHPDTAAAGAEILRRGGNAVDAAVAATFASFIAEAVLVNIGGGGIAHLYQPTTQQSIVYDFFSTMPGKGNPHLPPDMDFRQVSLDFGSAQQIFYIGRASTAVPGVVAGLCELAERHGSLPLATLLEPAIRLAETGSQLTAGLAFVSHLLEPIFSDTAASRAIYAPAGRMATTGETLTFIELAQTLRQLGQQGRSLFYTGALARHIVADHQAQGGLITPTDLASYEVQTHTPIRVAYREHTILLPPPSSLGGVLVAFALRLLTRFPLPEIAHNRFDHLRLLAEIMRLTDASRAEWGMLSRQLSPAQAIEQFLSETTINRYAQQIEGILADQASPPRAAVPVGPSNTTHLSVVDGAGMMVSITTSAGESAGYVVGDTGVMLNNMLGEIDLHPEGFHRQPPGQRLMTMMCPTIVLRHEQPILTLGSGGSNRIRSAILQTLSNIIDFEMSLPEAVNAPRFHFENDQAQLEAGIDPQVGQQLEQAGYTVNLWDDKNMFFGGAHAVAHVDEATFQAAGDFRRGGAVVVL